MSSLRATRLSSPLRARSPSPDGAHSPSLFPAHLPSLPPTRSPASSRLRLHAPVLLALLLAAAPLAAQSGRNYRNDAMKVRALEPPVGWEPQPTGSYTRLLASWSDKDAAKLTLVASRVPPKMTARALADESRAALVRMGWRYVVESNDQALSGDLPRVRLDAQLDDGRKMARQVYVVADGIGYVLTVIGPAAHAPQLRRDFDETLLSFELGAEPAAPVDAGTDVTR